MNFSRIALLALVLGAASAGAAEPAAQAPKMGQVGVAAERTVATVVAVDQEGRRVTLRDSDGVDHEYVLGDEVRNLAQVEVGDQVIAEYAVAAAVALYPATGTAKGRVDTEAFTRSDLGQKPYARTQQTVEITARVKTVDKEARIVTVEGKNAEVSVQVPDDVNLDEVEPGEMVRVEYVEAAVISVESPEKAGR